MRANDIFRDFDFLNPWQNFYVNQKDIDLEWLECATVHCSTFLQRTLFEHVGEIHDKSIHLQSYEVITPGADARVREALKKQPLVFSQHSLWVSIQEILHVGAKRARTLIEPTVEEVADKMGIVRFLKL